jgi:hypothetical protein
VEPVLPLGNLPPVLQGGGIATPAKRDRAADAALRLPSSAALSRFPIFEYLSDSSFVWSAMPSIMACSSAVTIFGAALALSMVEAISSAASTVSASHSAIARPVDMFPALASRSKIAKTSAVTGTETRGGFDVEEGGEMVLVMCGIMQHCAANTTVFHGAMAALYRS